MKIAICLSGQPRSINFTYKSILSYFSGNYDCDFFCHSWDYNTWKLQNTTYDEYHTVDTSALANSLQNFTPVKFVIENNQNLKKISPKYNSYHSLLYSAMKSNHLKRIHEVKNDFRYDYVVKARYDNVFPPNAVFNPPQQVHSRTIYHSNFSRISIEYNRVNPSDCIYYGDSLGMDIASDMFRYFSNAVDSRRSDNIEMIGPGTGMFTYASSLNVNTLNANGSILEIFYRKEALGLDANTDFDKILAIHRSFYTPQT